MPPATTTGRTAITRASLRRHITATVLATGLLLGCQVERAHETEACIDRLVEEGYEIADAQSECMGADGASTDDIG